MNVFPVHFWMWLGIHQASEQGQKDSSWFTAEQAGTGDILEPRLTCLLISNCLCCSSFSFSSLTTVSCRNFCFREQKLLIPLQVISKPSHSSSSGQSSQWLSLSSTDWTSCQLNDEMKSFIFILRGKMNFLPSFSPWLSNTMAKPRVCTSTPSLHAELIKILVSYSARLEEIGTTKPAPCH